jgi:hypothetical protein
MRSLPYLRIAIDLFLFSSIIFAPLVAVIILAIIGLVFFAGYVEVIVAFLCLDLLYMGGTFLVDTRPITMLPMTFYAVVAFVLAGVLRRKFRERN